MGFLIVFLGGGLGAALRHSVNLSAARLLGSAFPYATIFENVSGSLVMGLLAAYTKPRWSRPTQDVATSLSRTSSLLIRLAFFDVNTHHNVRDDESAFVSFGIISPSRAMPRNIGGCS
jgi:hypothetical protein